MTNLKDLDIIHGGGRKLDKVLGEAVRYAQGRASAVVVHSTCIPTVIGDDAASVVARWAKKSKVPVLYSNPAEHSEGLDIGLTVFKKMLKDPSFTKVPRRKMAVNLVGFPEGPGLQELVRLLIDAGITINTRVMPRLDLEEAKHYLAAPVQLFYPNAAFEATYRELFEPMPIRSLRLEAPYGMQGTTRWLKKLASEFGAQPRMGAGLKKALTPIADAWDAARQEASGKGLAFVVDAIHAKRFSDPAQMWGIPVLRVLKEMGFGVNILCYGTSRKRREGLSFFKTQKELTALLAKGRFQAVYSEYACDARLAEAGKAQFSLDCFEIGLSGALRTLKKLNEICGWPFYRRYARHLREGK